MKMGKREGIERMVVWEANSRFLETDLTLGSNREGGDFGVSVVSLTIRVPLSWGILIIRDAIHVG